MERLIILTLLNAFAGKIIVKETDEGVFINNSIIGNSRFKKFAHRNFIQYEYVGGDNYKIIL